MKYVLILMTVLHVRNEYEQLIQVMIEPLMWGSMGEGANKKASPEPMWIT